MDWHPEPTSMSWPDCSCVGCVYREIAQLLCVGLFGAWGEWPMSRSQTTVSEEIGELRQRVAQVFAVPLPLLGPKFVPRDQVEAENEQLACVEAMGLDPFMVGNHRAERAAMRRSLRELGLSEEATWLGLD